MRTLSLVPCSALLFTSGILSSTMPGHRNQTVSDVPCCRVPQSAPRPGLLLRSLACSLASPLLLRSLAHPPAPRSDGGGECS